MVKSTRRDKTLSIASADPSIERTLVKLYQNKIKTPFSGRQLPQLLLQSGLSELSVESFSVPLRHDSIAPLLAAEARKAAKKRRIDPAKTEEWFAQLQAANDRGEFFAHLCSVVVAGTVSEV